MTGRRLVVIVDSGSHGDHLAEWQRLALATLLATDSLILLACTNTRLPRKLPQHPFYYALNLLAVRNRLTRTVPLSGIAALVIERYEFASEPDGAWQKLPQAVIDLIAGSGAVAVIKLGMGLMRVPADLTLPVLSWHHGDPERFRGRPAGFWELASGHPVIGQMVQVISNRLDGGRVVAFAETRVFPHSWKATLLEAFRHSPLLLKPAIDRALAGDSLTKPTTGRNYRLPGNWTVAKVAGRLGWAKVKRLAYGGFMEKDWRVSLAPVTGPQAAAAVVTGTAELPVEPHWTHLANPPGCTFVADPFFADDGQAVLVEALSARTGAGEIHRIDDSGSRKLSRETGHYSYPALVHEDGAVFCVPEIAQWSAPLAYRVTDSLEPHAALEIADNPRITDPTFVRHDGGLYLFGNVASEGSNVLRLWSAAGLFARFTEHPASPVRISPRGSRMGGDILHDGTRMIRIGQDFSRDYGDGLIAFAIDSLTPHSYRETEIGAFRLTDRKGPHTFNLSPDGKRILFDWYRDGFSPFAGVRRILARLRRK